MMPPVIYLTARHFSEQGWLPCIVPSGKFVRGDNTELEGKISGSDVLGSARIVGSCLVRHSPSPQRLWESVGGPTIVLFMLHQYIKESSDNTSVDIWMEKTAISAIALVEALVKDSLPMREIFLQEHGFHVLASCLRKLCGKLGALNKAIVEGCLSLARSLKTDLLQGDAAAAVLQGILFDFNVWGHISLENRIYLLENICSLTPTIGSCIRQYIGLQRIMDIARKYFAVDDNGSENTHGMSESAENIIIHLVTIVVKAAHQDYVRHTPTASSEKSLKPAQKLRELDILFLCLEETSRPSFADKLVLLIIELLYDCPRAVVQALASTRFYDVTVVSLLTSPMYSSRVRRSALHLFLWGLIQEYPDLSRDILYWLEKYSRGMGSGEIKYQDNLHDTSQLASPGKDHNCQPCKLYHEYTLKIKFIVLF